ncbi:MAG: hypothetical protein ACD_2C00208G0003 [uncultured bacterium (gcode 4)]|uniref:Uncharacterized protein n=1 Tax=uncultured bacterium (gcode 4) TaxID=1234023 RepID=K2G4F5_9BACT|nr:MAG: hypothetical protein ACD_2C00208G0003 [uncultured bacterium (gcode 4)]
MKKNLILLLFTWFTLGSVICFYYIGGFVNYPVHLEVRSNIVNHPEFVPSKTFVKAASAWYDNVVADIYWLDSIQYIGSNALASEYKKYLYVVLNLVTDLNPNFYYPYQIWQLLLSTSNERYENFNKSEQSKYVDQSIALWLKWISNTCDATKVEQIKKEFDLKKLWTSAEYKNPCSEPNIPYYLAYTYYWSKYDWARSSEYYRVTSANENAPVWSRVMSAVMQWKSWDRQKSILMFLSLAESLWTKQTKACSEFSSYLWWMLFKWFQEWKMMDWKFVRDIDIIRKDLMDKLWIKSTAYSITDEGNCSNYLNKAVREMNLAYLEAADKVYFEKNKEHAQKPEILLSAWLINYIPQDYQYDKDSKVIYYYNKDTWHWDNKMWE